MSKYADFQVSKIKKNFPDAGVLLSQLTTTITTTWASGAPYEHTDSTGIKELIVSPLLAVAGCTGVIVAFDAPNDAVASAWLADTTTNSSVLQYVFVPVGTTRKFVFNTAITRWDYKAVGNSATVYEEISR